MHSGSRAFTPPGLAIVAFIRLRALVQSYAPRCPRVHLGLRGLTRSGLGFARVYEGLLWRDKWSSGSLAFAWVRSDAPSSRRVHLNLRGFSQVHIWVI